MHCPDYSNRISLKLQKQSCIQVSDRVEKYTRGEEGRGANVLLKERREKREKEKKKKRKKKKRKKKIEKKEKKRERKKRKKKREGKKREKKKESESIIGALDTRLEVF